MVATLTESADSYGKYKIAIVEGTSAQDVVNKIVELKSGNHACIPYSIAYDSTKGYIVLLEYVKP